jgi:amino acid transporter
MTERSQYVLILLAITFTSLMGLMGYARSGLRENWHIFGVMPDTSPEAFTPRLGDAVNVIAVIMVLFFALVGFIFWIGLLGEKKKETDVHNEAQAVSGSD